MLLNDAEISLLTKLFLFFFIKRGSVFMALNS